MKNSIVLKVKESLLEKGIDEARIMEFEKISKNILSEFNSCKSERKALLIGKVQSGKTSAFLYLISMALEMDFKDIVVLTGTTNILNDQTSDEVKKRFVSQEIYEGTDGERFKIGVHDAEAIEGAIQLENHFKNIIVSKKGATTKLLSNLKKTKRKTLIIDDESDFATHNTQTAKNKVLGMRTTTNDVLHKIFENDKINYLAITATPQSNVLIRGDEFNSPAKIDFINPGKGYMGVSYFFESPSKFISIVPDGEAEKLRSGVTSINEINSLYNALMTFIVISASISSGLIRKNNFDIEKSKFEKVSMMINFDLSTKNQKVLEESIRSFLKVNLEDESYIKKLFKRNYILETFDFLNINNSENEKVLIKEVQKLKNILIISLNSDKDSKDSRLKNKAREETSHKIYIGGHNLSRGMVVPNLVVSYFILDSKKPQADTVLQRARWFGYREQWKDVIKLYTTGYINSQFRDIMEVEREVWPDNGNRPDMQELRRIYLSYKLVEPTPKSKRGSKIEDVKVGVRPLYNNFDKVNSQEEHSILVSVFDKIMSSSVNKNDHNEFFTEIEFNSAADLACKIEYEIKQFLQANKQLEEITEQYESFLSDYPQIGSLINTLNDLHSRGAAKKIKMQYFHLKGEPTKIIGTVKKTGYALKDRYVPFGRNDNGRLGDREYAIMLEGPVHAIQISKIQTDKKLIKLFFEIFEFSDKTEIRIS